MPVVGHDDHLPALPTERVDERAVRARFASPPAVWQPEFPGDGVRFTSGPTVAAAVLVGLVAPRVGDTSLRMLLTQRSLHLSNHAGHVSFPGGRVDPGDADVVAAALREAHEEVGLEPQRVDVIGTLPTYGTVTGFLITPVVGIVEPPPAYRPEPGEVTAVFEVPLAFLMNPAHHRRHRFDWEGQTRDFLSMPWVDPQARADEPPDRFIWGATAAMIRNLYRFLAA